MAADRPGRVPSPVTFPESSPYEPNRTKPHMVDRIIHVEKNLKEQLKNIQAPGESYTDVIERLADQAGVSLDGGVEVDAEAEQMAGEVMTAADTLAADGPKSEYLRETYDVDPANYDDVEQLRQAVREAPTEKADIPHGGGAEVDTETEQMAEEVMTPVDRRIKDGQSNAEFLQETYDVNPTDYDDVEQLRQAVRGGPGR